MSPRTGLVFQDSTFSTRLFSLTTALTLNRPGTVNEIVVFLPPSSCVCTVALYLSAGLMTPCGVIHSWYSRSPTGRRRIDRTLAQLTPGQRAAHRRRQAL